MGSLATRPDVVGKVIEFRGYRFTVTAFDPETGVYKLRDERDRPGNLNFTDWEWENMVDVID